MSLRYLKANHFGTFSASSTALADLATFGSRPCYALSSGAHRFSDIDFDDANYHRRSYDRWKAYGQSKTANALFALGLDMHGEAHGVRAFSVHPGSIATELTRHVSLEDMQAVGFRDEEGNIPPRIASLRSFCYLELLHRCRNYLSVSGSFRTRSR